MVMAIRPTPCNDRTDIARHGYLNANALAKKKQKAVFAKIKPKKVQ